MESTSKRLAEFYDKIYSENKDPFGTEPDPLVKTVLDYLQTGDVIEFGAGEGRNSLFLASKGFRVKATDISPVALSKIKEKARERNVSLETENVDITRLELTESYDLIISTFTLHHLTREQALAFLENIKEHARPRGFIIITSFTKNGDFYRNNPKTDRFYLSENELRSLFSDCEILTYLEKEGKALAKKADGSPMFNVFAGIIARKL